MTQLTPEEQQVYDCIKNSPTKITQMDIARQVYVGCHERFEGYNTPKGSTTRQVRRIIRDLRIKHYLHILSDGNGYWILKDKEEIREYLLRIEKTAKSQAKAWWVTYNAMRRNFGIKSEYFEQQGKLFE